MGNTRDTQYSRDAQAHADQLAAPSRSLTTKAVVLAAVLALIAAVAFVGAMGRDANAYIPYIANENGNGGKPTITAEMKNPSSFVGPGEFHTYNGSVKFENVNPDAGGTYTVTVNADENLPLTSKISKTNTFLTELRGARVTNVDVKDPNPGSTQVTYTLEPTSKANEIYLEFRMNSKMPSKVPEATVINASINGRFEPNKAISVVPVRKEFKKGELSCTGTGLFKYKLPQGGYLMDIKFADAKPAGIKFSSVQISEDESSKNYIVAKNGTDKISLLDDATYLANDPTPPYYGNASPLVVQYQGAKWIDSYNWEYDPSMSTGEKWLPAGTTIEIKREVTFENCILGFATDGEIDRSDAFISVVEVGKNVVPVSNGASTSFVTPGEYTPPKTCEDIWNVGGRSSGPESGGKPNGLGRWIKFPDNLTYKDTGNKVYNPDKNDPTKYKEKRNNYSNSIAVSDNGWLSGKLWYLTESGTQLAYADLSKPGYIIEFIDIENTITETRAGALAFSPDGFLYLFSDELNPTVWKMDVLNKKYTWEKVIDRIEYSEGQGKNGNVKDYVVNADGSLTVLSYNPTWKEPRIYTIDSEALQTGSFVDSTYTAPVGNIRTPQSGKEYKDLDPVKGAFWGMAYDSDGNLYISSYEGWLQKVTISPAKNGKDLEVIATEPNMVNLEKAVNEGSGDLASCNYGKKKERPKGSLRVQKSAIDPVTGAIAAPGQTTSTDHPLKLKDGVLTPEYLVTVYNQSDERVTSGVIRDAFDVPAGMKISSVTVSQVGTNNSFTTTNSEFEIDPGTLESKELKSYRVSITLKVDDLQESYQSSKECTLGQNQLGFFNKVTIEGDSKTEDKHGCIPGEIPPSAKIKLVKKIVDRDGNEIQSSEVDDVAKAFELSLGNVLPEGDLEPNSLGFHGPGPRVPRADYRRVPVGSYQLAEGISSGKSEVAKHFYQHGSWKCEENPSSSAEKPGFSLNSESRVVSIKEGSEVTCTVKNAPKAFVDKVPSEVEEAELNKHVGKPLVASDDGKLVAKYKIRVYTDAPNQLPVNSGPIFDRFKVPNGLLWDDTTRLPGASEDGNATVESIDTYAPNSEATGVKFEVTEKQLSKGIQIVENVTNLVNSSEGENRYRFEFEVSIPLKIDERQDGDETVFSKHYAALKECRKPKGMNENKFVEPGGGILNDTFMNDEDQSSSEGFWQEDNRACIPVKIDPKWAVEKLAKSSGGSGWSKTGDTLTPTEENGEQKVTAQYRVTVTNTGHIPDTQPVVNDNVTLNGGFKVESMKVERVTFNETGEVTSREDVNASDVDPAPGTESNTVGFKIPAKEGLVNAGDSVEYLVTVVGVRSGEPSGETATNVQKCQDSNGGYQSNLGLHNKVALEGVTDSDGDKNNEACIPVQPSNKKIQVLKFSGGDNPQEIVGAEFVVYPDNGGNPDTSKGSALTVIEEAGKKTHKFESAELVAGKDYWLKETKAPSGNELLPEAVKFRLSSEGVKLYAKNGTDQVDEALGGSFKLDTAENGNAFAIKVYDPRAMELPKSGGIGRWPMVGVGVLLFMLSTLYMMKTSGVSRRRD